MKYPLPEIIGNPGLLVGREEEFDDFYRWIDRMPDLLSMSRVILARRKSGKTSMIQRIFNKLWSDNGPVIPFYISIPDAKVWFPDFATRYFTTFASHYISFLERNEKFANNILSVNQIKEYATAKKHELLENDADLFVQYRNEELYDSLWRLACSAPAVMQNTMTRES